MKRTVCAAVLLFSTSASATELQGRMFGDYYYVFAAEDGETELPAKRNAFHFRRIYFSHRKLLGEDVAAFYRLEARDAGFAQGAKMEPFVKNAYLHWKRLLGDSELYLGLVGTPTWAVAEKVWGYRSVAKTVLDWNKIGSSADLGAVLKGAVGRLAYHLMVGNGPGQKSEDDHGKKFYASLSFKPGDRLVLEGYADLNKKPAGRDEQTFKGFVGWQGAQGKAGLEVFSRTNDRADADEGMAGASAFGSLPLSAEFKGFGRVDVVARDAEDAADWLIIAGLDYSVAPAVHLMPNVVVARPADRSANVQGRLTFFCKF